VTRNQARSSLLANLALIVGSLVFTVLLLAALEGALRFLGLGAPDEARASRLKYQQIYLPIFESAVRPDGQRILRITDTRLPYQSILTEKPANGLRVFTFGGSATAGLGFSPNVTFARHLERMLKRAYPDRLVEVVNLGIVALAARQVKVLVEDVCRNFSPDAVLIYSGNNEFLEIHAEKYAAANANPITRLRDLAAQTNLYRLLDRLIRGAPKTPSLAQQNLTAADLRMTEEALIRDIEMQPEEIEAITDRYEKTMEGIATVCQENQAPVVLMTVASNWRWRGREDLPADWLDELVPSKEAPLAERYRQALDLLAERIASSSRDERYEWQFKRAVAAESLGEFEAARDDYRASMNNDPHLRRALDTFAERVRRVARDRGTYLVDVVKVLSTQASHGIIGFDEFYDYVHFTPRGVVLVAAEAFRAMLGGGILPEPENFDPDDYVQERSAWQAGLTEDPLDVAEWLGFGFDQAGITDRDLWKYDKLLKVLDERIEKNPQDLNARVYRGNAYSFRIDGAARADSDYRAALAVAGDNAAILSNLERLVSERQP
jgi:hypothetical protein